MKTLLNTLLPKTQSSDLVVASLRLKPPHPNLIAEVRNIESIVVLEGLNRA